MKLLEPRATEDAEEFWAATRKGELVLPWCHECNAAFWYPRPVCPRCLSPDIGWEPASGEGEVYAVSVQHRPGIGRDADDGPYAVAIVSLAEGVRMLSNVVGCPPDSVEVGMAVRLTWHELSDGRQLPIFEPG